MSDFDDLMLQGFSDAASILGPAGQSTPSQIAFNGQAADCVSGALTSGRMMLPAGYQFEYDQDCVLSATDFARLGFGYEDEVAVDGTTLRVHKWEFDGPLVTVYLKAPR